MNNTLDGEDGELFLAQVVRWLEMYNYNIATGVIAQNVHNKIDNFNRETDIDNFQNTETIQEEVSKEIENFLERSGFFIIWLIWQDAQKTWNKG